MTEIVATALPSVNCGSDAIMRAFSSIQLFGRASVHNGPVFKFKTFIRAKGNSQERSKGCTASAMHAANTSSSETLTSCAFCLRHPDKDSHRFCDIMSVLDVEEQFQCFVRQELCYVLPDCIKGGN